MAIGNESRQSIIIALMKTTCTNGLRVGEIAEQIHLSRPSVSHHLKILRDAGIIKMREEGAKNFYFIDMNTNLASLRRLAAHISEFIDEYY